MENVSAFWVLHAGYVSVSSNIVDVEKAQSKITRIIKDMEASYTWNNELT